jgi:voltage-gated potassium channel Kch
MKKPTLVERLRYAFDNTLTRGPIALIGWLALATMIIIALAVLVDLAIGGISREQGLGPAQVIWSLVFQALVPNPPGSFENPWQFLVVMLGVTVISLLGVSLLIGLMSSGIENRVDRLRRGRSRVIESGHTVILGWSEQVFTIVSELQIANENRRHTAIALLGDRDKVEMEEEVRHRVQHSKRTRTVARHGSPFQHADLNLVSPQTSRSIIILSDGEERPDAATIKTILAVTGATDRRSEPYHIVGVVRDPKNLEIARMVGGDEVELVLSGDVIAKIMAQTSRQRGLSIVYSELLDFAGDEICVQEEPQLVGKTYGEAILAYEDSAVMGLHTQDGVLLLNPPMDTTIRSGDRIVAISEDDDTVRLRPVGASEPGIQADAIVTGEPAERKPERILILGWNWRGVAIISQLDAYVTASSTVSVVADSDTAEADIGSVRSSLVNLTVAFSAADTSRRETLEALDVHRYDHILILAYSDSLDHQHADARTMMTLLHLRIIANKGGHVFSIVSEMMDARNRDLADVARVDDFIVSERLVSLLLAQVSENKALNAVFDDLLDPVGSEIYLKPATDYVKPGVAVSFATVVEAARRRGETAIGYRLLAWGTDPRRSYGVAVNPDKSAAVTFSPEDRVIVLAQD